MNEVHGNIHRLQCIRGRECKNSDGNVNVWSDAVTIEYDTATYRASSELPHCPVCGLLARPNVWFCTDRNYACWDASRDISLRYQAWLESLSSGRYGAPSNTDAAGKMIRLVVIECGAGLVIPSSRVEAEDVAENTKGTLIRINPVDFAVPRATVDGEGPSCSVGLPMGSKKALQLMRRGWRNCRLEAQQQSLELQRRSRPRRCRNLPVLQNRR